MTAWDFLEALRTRWKLVLGITLLVVAAVGLWSMRATPHYVASATVLIDNAQPDPVTTQTASSDSSALLGTQADIIRSALVSERVIENLKLDQNPEVIARWRAATNGSGTLRDWLARGLLSGLQVLPGKNTNVLQISYSGTDPDFVALIANAFADAYVQTQLQLRVEPAKVYSQWYETRIRDVRQRLENAQARLTGFQRAQGLIGAQKVDIEIARLTELSSQLSAAQAQAVDSSSRASNNAGASPEVQMSGLVQGLDSQIASKSAAMSQMRQIYGPNHPALQSGEAELAALRGKRAEAVAAGAGSLQVASQAAAGREAGIRARLEQQRALVLKLSGVQDQVAVLQRDVDAAQAAFESVTQRLNSVRLQSEIPQTNASLLDRAVAPFYPASPNIPLRMVLAVLVGLMIGIGVALAIEWFNPRARTIAGIESETRVPVLADLNNRRPLRLLSMPGQGR